MLRIAAAAGVAGARTVVARTAAVRGISGTAARRMAEGDAAEATQVTLNFAVPHEAVYSDTEVDLVIIPGITGDYGVTAGHTPIISELRAGTVEIFHKEGDEAEKFFVSGGYAMTHPNSVTDISAVEAVRLEDLDPEAARQGYAKFKAEMDAATPETPEHAFAQIGMDTHEAMCTALGVSLN